MRRHTPLLPICDYRTSARKRSSHGPRSTPRASRIAPSQSARPSNPPRPGCGSPQPCPGRSGTSTRWPGSAATALYVAMVRFLQVLGIYLATATVLELVWSLLYKPSAQPMVLSTVNARKSAFSNFHPSNPEMTAP